MCNKLSDLLVPLPIATSSYEKSNFQMCNKKTCSHFATWRPLSSRKSNLQICNRTNTASQIAAIILLERKVNWPTCNIPTVTWHGHHHPRPPPRSQISRYATSSDWLSSFHLRSSCFNKVKYTDMQHTNSCSYFPTTSSSSPGKSNSQMCNRPTVSTILNLQTLVSRKSNFKHATATLTPYHY